MLDFHVHGLNELALLLITVESGTRQPLPKQSVSHWPVYWGHVYRTWIDNAFMFTTNDMLRDI